MIRRRRVSREIPFSFDSFLDVVANVVGIIIRLILVVWVGARSYTGIQMLAKPKPRAEVAAVTTLPEDPLERELAQQRQELAALQARLLEQLRQVDQVKTVQTQTQGKLTEVLSMENVLEEEERGVQQDRSKAGQQTRMAELTLDEVRRRREKVLQEICAAEKLPPLKQMLRYRTPVSKPVTTEEYFFECREGRVAFIDIGTMLAEVSRTINNKTDALRSNWQVTDTTAPVGAFRLRYTVERNRGSLESIIDGGPGGGRNFSFGVSEWWVEPASRQRGESLAEALAATSEFRQVTEALDGSAVVTFWVYPDSFEVFRKLRDVLYERDVVVAGRPMPPEAQIGATKNGFVSRGQ